MRRNTTLINPTKHYTVVISKQASNQSRMSSTNSKSNAKSDSAIPKQCIVVCGVCDEKLNRSKHSLVVCQYCPFEACRTCCQTYLLGQSTPKCMEGKCGKEWTRKFLIQQFTKSFVNGALRKHMEKVMVDKETALLPATQLVLEERQRVHNLMYENMETLKLFRFTDTKIRELEKRVKSAIKTDGINSVEPLTIEIDVLKIQRVDYENKLEWIRIQRNNGGDVDVSKKSGFVRPCPAESCRGFMSCEWNCGLCHASACSKCHVIINSLNATEEEHVCNADDVATAKLLAKDTKACPKCYTGIFKIDGCDQMWCVQCHTAFSWRTGLIETRIHNPHYFEWQRRTGGGGAAAVPRADGDVLCGRELTHHTLGKIVRITNGNRKIKNKTDIPERERNVIDHILVYLGRAIHLKESVVPQYRVDDVENNMGLRIKYLQKQIDLPTFQSRIYIANKKHDLKREIHTVLQMNIHAITDIVYRMIDILTQSQHLFNQLDSRHTSADWVNRQSEITLVYKHAIDTFKEIIPLSTYVNECLAEISSTYGSVRNEVVIDGPAVYRNGVLSILRPVVSPASKKKGVAVAPAPAPADDGGSRDKAIVVV